MDYAKINACATGSLGVQLFRESIAYGNAQGIYVRNTTRTRPPHGTLRT